MWLRAVGEPSYTRAERGKKTEEGKRETEFVGGEGRETGRETTWEHHYISELRISLQPDRRQKTKTSGKQDLKESILHLDHQHLRLLHPHCGPGWSMPCHPCHPCRWSRQSAWSPTTLWQPCCPGLRVPITTVQTWIAAYCWRGKEVSLCRGTSLATLRAAPATGSVHGRIIVSVPLLLFAEICFYFWEAQVVRALFKQSGRCWPPREWPSCAFCCLDCVWSVVWCQGFSDFDSRMGSEVGNVWRSEMENNSVRK